MPNTYATNKRIRKDNKTLLELAWDITNHVINLIRYRKDDGIITQCKQVTTDDLTLMIKRYMDHNGIKELESNGLVIRRKEEQ